jgi:glycolate oxidase FAD binding subunit
VTTPITASAEAVRDRLRDAAARATALRITGASTWLDAGRPTSTAETVSTRELAGIVSYVPGDLTLTARAGTSLAEILDAAAAQRQWLALDPFGTDDGTIGATVATASAGPLSAAFGSPRDLVLGVEFVTGDARIVRGGGRVVKNVAGFDLTRLVTGSWGTIGVITEVTVRLHARPAVDETVAIPLGDDPAALDRCRALLRRSPFTPFACEVLNAPLAHALLGRDELVALIRLGGNADAVRGQREAVAALGRTIEVDADVWRRLRAVEPPHALVIRLSRPPTELTRTWMTARAVDGAGGLVHANVARGVVRCVVPASEANADAVAELLRRRGDATGIGERLPPSVWALLPPPMSRNLLPPRIKAAFDPKDLLNSGILGGVA